MPLHKLLFIIQSENYDIRRFLKWCLQNPWTWLSGKKIEKRQHLVWTLKTKLIATASVGIVFLIPVLIIIFTGEFIWAFAIAALLATLLLPLCITIALILVLPFDRAVRARIIGQAHKKILSLSKTKVIAITGSYGKTTMKEVLTTILSTQFKVFKTPGNINTDLGIAQLILKESLEDYDVIVVEMGAYRRGDIKTLCKLVQPDISILTGINEAHLDRFGSLKNTVETKFEIVQHIKKDGVAFLNGTNDLVIKNAPNYCKNKRCQFFGKKSEYEARNIKWKENGGYEFDVYHFAKKVFSSNTKLLGSYAPDTMICGMLVAQELGMNNEAIAEAIKSVKPVPHRLELIKAANGAVIIDDAYNGNPDGAREAVKTLGQFESRRKLYLTPGLVEIGSRSKEVHIDLGKHLSDTADKVLLIKNSVTPFIAEGLNKSGFSEDDIVWFDTTKDAHDNVGTLLKSNDVIVFQNDWSDNYI